MAASDLVKIEYSWDIARTVDIIFVVFALIVCILRLISKYKCGSGKRVLADDLMIVASVGDFVKSFWIAILTDADNQFCVICSPHLA